MRERNVILSLIILLLAGGVAFYFIKIYKPAQNQGITPITQDSVKESLEKSDPFLLPDITSRDTAHIALPAGLESLLVPNAESTSVVKVGYPNNKKGYLIQMEVKNLTLLSILNVYTKFYADKTGTWEVKHGQYSQGFGIISLENALYQAQVEVSQSQGGGDYYLVAIKILNK